MTGGTESEGFESGTIRPSLRQQETSGIPVQWGAPQDHAACGDAIAAARAAGARHALLSLAAEIEALNDWPKLESISDETAEYARGTTTGIAQMARRRAQDHPGAPSSTSPPQEDPELTLVGLSPAQAYMAGVKAERERIAALAERVDAFYDAPCPDGDPECVHQDTPFAGLIREGSHG